VQKNQEGPELNETRDLLACDDVNLLGYCIGTIKNTEALSDTSKEVGLEVNSEKQVYVAVSSPECMAEA
jgi:hypothetical protein